MSNQDEVLYGSDPNVFNTRCEGASSDDTLTCTSGNDVLIGQQGRDTLSGGAGNDVFVFMRRDDRGDVITDFTPGSDRVSLSFLLLAEGVTSTDPLGDGLVGTGASRGQTYLYYFPPGERAVTLARVIGASPAELAASLVVGP